MNEILGLLTRHGAAVVFVVAFLEQIGAPVTAIPVFIVAGAVAANTDGSFVYLLGLAVAGALIADTIWFLIGRRYGTGVLSVLCRISLSPDSCVRQTENFFERWGVGALIVSKFLPGLSLVAPPLAGASPKSKLSTFLLYDTIGAIVWAGTCLIIGVVFRHAIDRVLNALVELGGWALVLLGGTIALYVFHKWYERRRFYRSLRLARIPIEELNSRIAAGESLTIIDVRSTAAQRRDPRHIPGALMLATDEIDGATREIDRSREIVLYCT